MLSWYEQRMGALVTDSEIPGITHKLPEEAAIEYGGPYFIAESMNLEAAKLISAALKLTFMGTIRPFGTETWGGEWNSYEKN